jgi:penicillin-binding protein 1B
MKLPSFFRNKPRFLFGLPVGPLRLVALLLLLGLSGYIYYLDVTIREAFDGRKFALPARVYGRALEVYPGLKLTRDQFVGEMKSLGYHDNPQPDTPATYRNILNGIEFTTRDFVFGDGDQPSQHLRIGFADDKVSSLQVRGSKDVDLPLLRMDPPLIGGIYPGHNEDRELVRLNQVPKMLINALIATEDRKFYTHWGIDPRGIARALYKAFTGQEHAHPAAGEEFFPDSGTHADAQGERSADGAAARIALQQGGNPRNLSQRDIPRAGCQPLH